MSAAGCRHALANALGFDVRDVRHVVLTHLHTDHAGGIFHFPTAAHAASRAEIEHASGLRGKLRGYLPQHWPRWFDPRPLDFDGPPFGPFASSEPLTEAGDVVLLRTPGHTPGHLGHVGVVRRSLDAGNQRANPEDPERAVGRQARLCDHEPGGRGPTPR